MTQVSRNDPCPCGSGLKYKRCHQLQDAEKPRSAGMLPLIALGVVILGGAAVLLIGLTQGPEQDSRPGRIWSAEHGHWHDAPAPSRGLPTGGRAVPPPGTPAPPKPSPVGTPPPGKVWSSDHGHWHDAPGASAPPLAITVGPSP